MIRRNFLAFAGTAGLLAGCGASGTPIIAPATFLADLSGVVKGLTMVVTSPAVAFRVPANVATALATAQDGVAALQAALALDTDLSTLAARLKAVDDAIGVVLTFARPFADAAGFGLEFAAVSVLLPVIEPTINAALVKAFGPKLIKAAAAFPLPGRMTPAEARAVLAR
jgi:hypothetical protein